MQVNNTSLFYIGLISDWLAEHKNIVSAQINKTDYFVDYDLDSITTVKMLNYLEGFTGHSLEAHLTIEYETIDKLADYLSNFRVKVDSKIKSASEVTEDELDSEEVVLPDFV